MAKTNEALGPLEQLIDAGRQVRSSPADRERQRQSFAYGNTAFENSLITREMIDDEANKHMKRPVDE